MIRRRVPRARALLAITGALTLSTTLAAAPLAYAETPSTTVVATGLDNPRQLSFGPGQRLYVAEAGRGGDGECTTGAEGTVCFGLSGAITEINGTTQTRVLSGLPSVANQDGSGAQGPADVDVRGANVAILFGLGLTTEQRTGLGADAADLGTIQTGRLRTGDLSTAADLAAWESRREPGRPGGALQPDRPAGPGLQQLGGGGRRGQCAAGGRQAGEQHHCGLPARRIGAGPGRARWDHHGTAVGSDRRREGTGRCLLRLGAAPASRSPRERRGSGRSFPARSRLCTPPA